MHDQNVDDLYKWNEINDTCNRITRTVIDRKMHRMTVNEGQKC